MNADFTEAVTPTSTAVEPPVKRLRRGDVREDGMVFWKYHTKAKNGEYWLPRNKFQEQQVLSRQYSFTYDRLRYRDKKEEIKIRSARYYKENREDKLRYQKQYASKNKGRRKQYVLATRDRVNSASRARYASDSLYALKKRYRNRVRRILKRKGFKKNTKTAAMLGCTYAEFRTHIERLFLPGMSWANFSKCHIDHLVPLDAAKTEEEVYALNHFTNLRPMWGPENIAKNATLPEEHELPANLHTKVKEIYLTAKARSA